MTAQILLDFCRQFVPSEDETEAGFRKAYMRAFVNNSCHCNKIRAYMFSESN